MRLFLFLIATAICFSCGKKQHALQNFTCPCVDAKYCAYMSDFRKYLHANGYLSNPNRDYFALYNNVKSGKVSLQLSKVWEKDFDFRTNYVVDFDLIRICYDSIYQQDQGHLGSWSLINYQVRRALGDSTLDTEIVRQVSGRASKDPVEEFAMLHFILSEALRK